MQPLQNWGAGPLVLLYHEPFWVQSVSSQLVSYPDSTCSNEGHKHRASITLLCRVLYLHSRHSGLSTGITIQSLTRLPK